MVEKNVFGGKIVTESCGTMVLSGNQETQVRNVFQHPRSNVLREHVTGKTTSRRVRSSFVFTLMHTEFRFPQKRYDSSKHKYKDG